MGNLGPILRPVRREQETPNCKKQPIRVSPGARTLNTCGSGALGGQVGRRVARNLVSTFCYLSLERKTGDFVHGGGTQALLGWAAQAAEGHSRHHQDEEEEAHPVAEDACIHTARRVRLCQLLLCCKDMRVGAEPRLLHWQGQANNAVLGLRAGTPGLWALSPSATVKTCQEGQTQERKSLVEPAAPRPPPRHPGHAKATVQGPEPQLWGLEGAPGTKMGPGTRPGAPAIAQPVPGGCGVSRASTPGDKCRASSSTASTWQHHQPRRVMGKPDRIARQTGILPRILKGDIAQGQNL